VDMKESLERIDAEDQRKFEEQYEEMGLYIAEQNKHLEETLLKERNQDILDTFDFHAGDLSVAEEDAMVVKVGHLANFVAAEQNSLANIQKRIQTYDKMVEQLKRITNSSSLEEIISSYAAQEEEMFSLYNYIQTQNTEIEAVTEAAYKMSLEISLYDSKQQEEETKRMKALDSLQSRYDQTIESTNKQEEENSAHRELVHQISKKVQSLFFKLQCDQMESSKQPTNSAKGSKGGSSMARNESKISMLTGQGVTESNVLDYMGAVEQRAVDIVAEHIKFNFPFAGGRMSPTPGPSSPMHWPAEHSVDLPEFNDDELFMEGEDLDSKPVDLSTFKESLRRKISFGNTA